MRVAIPQGQPSVPAVQRRVVWSLVAALVGVSGCPDKDQHESIEAMNKGVEAYSQSRYSEAIAEFKNATQKHAANHQAWYNLGLVYAAQAQKLSAEAAEKAWTSAAEAFGEAVKHSDLDAMYHLWLGRVLYEGGSTSSSSRKQSLTHLQRAVELNKDLWRGHWYLGRSYRDAGQPKDAAEAFTKACTLNPLFGEPFIRLGELYLHWDMTKEAVNVLSQGAKTVKGDELTDVYYYLGLAYDGNTDMGDGRWSRAVEAYSKALDLKNSNDAARFQRGLTYLKLGEKEKAIKDLDEFLKSGGGGDGFNKYEASKAIALAMSGPQSHDSPAAVPR